ncbi:MAG: RagB/SusD family nutrient uptake outer membrane protein, partial [Gemmatimonadetes bacterium]|nr:RagB/SusD family nutrient uptake outer membrane protein [Gemmatimonadota bacterium]
MSPYEDVMAAALATLDEALALAGANSFTTEPWWMGGATITNTDMVAIIRSFKARFMASVGRTPAERSAANWSEIATLAGSGITTDFFVMGDDGAWWDVLKSYAGSSSPNHHSSEGSPLSTWGRLDVRYLGPADTGGNYQGWLAEDLGNRNEIPIETPDRRVTGSTYDSDGLYVRYIGGPSPFRDGRGSYHFSWYGDKRWDEYVDDAWADLATPMIEMTLTEMYYLRAEAMYRTGNQAGALAIINQTRVANGQLPASTITGPTDSDCVPRTDNGSCGDLWDALKYEKRIEVYHTGMGIAFFDDRGWGDLVDGTFFHLPIPGQELDYLGLPYYTFGGSWPSMVATQARGPVTVAPETLQSYWQDLRSRTADLKAEA